ncbi:universal stress protein [Thalassomonas viridans]|uniref:Universal stress protein n=1 Tax=Thalassomonas viridans TaxID=137584 RepID=A0AAF0CF27_9GAMM|nr:universal stress protein [Thalassomonas viridans]WDE09029.1 universal stress protein [Thalassomonas viridans]
MVKHVLVIADIEDDETFALEKARDLSLPSGTQLEIIRFIHSGSKPHLTSAQQMEQARESLAGVIKRVFDDESQVTSKVVDSEHIADWVLEHCRQKTVDLVVKSRHRTESLFHTPTDWQLLRQLPCPILIASHIKWKPEANILLPLDLSTDESLHQQLNKSVLQWGKFWAEANKHRLHAAYSIPIAKPLLELEIVDRHEIEQKKSPQAREKMAELLARFEMSDVPVHITAGPPEKTIPHLAGEVHCDLVIMGCAGHQGLSAYLHGHTTEKVLHNLRADCLVIKPAQD